MTGRGNLFKFLKDASRLSPQESSSSECGGDISGVKDSGIGTEDSTIHEGGEYGRIARDQICDDLSSSLSNINFLIGRGRAQLLESLRCQEIGDKQLSLQGRGRAFLPLEILSSFDKSSSSIKSDQEKERSTNTNDAEDKTKMAKVDKSALFCPVTISGIKGEPVKLATNFIKLESQPNMGVYVYEVRFLPPVDSRHLRTKFLNEHRQKLGGTCTFDGQILYLPILLELSLTSFVSKNNTDNSDVEIRVLFKKKESLKDCLNLYNMLIDRVMKVLNYVRFDRKQFDPTAPKIIPGEKLEVWPGYVTAVDEYDGGLMLCCDVSHRLLCQKTVLEMLFEIFQHKTKNFHEDAKKALIGSVVITRYNNRTYRIDDICFDENPKTTFETKDGPISYVDYYRRHYNLHINDLKQPLLISNKRQRGSDKSDLDEIKFCLIPELCHLTGLRDDMRTNQKLMREIITFTRVTPNQRLYALEKFYKNINNSPEAKQILKDWGLTLVQSKEIVTGRKMDEEQIIVAKKTFPIGPNADFAKYITSNELLEVINLKNWLLIHCDKDAKAASALITNLQKNSRSFGMEVAPPKVVVLDNDRVNTVVQALRTNIQQHFQIVVCLCSTSRDDRYSAIKKICCSEIPIPSQVINARTLANETKNRSIVQKIAIQMNCKMGGTLWSVRIPLKNSMICGIDSYHDAGHKEKSVSAMVSSLNSNFTRWYSKAVIQTKKAEIVNSLSALLTAALLAYENANGKKPDNIIIFRDGVGDGQLKLCSAYEIPQLEASCNYPVKITFIIVQKRIHTRYFPVTGINNGNPLPGTVVDTHITKSKMFDFYLVSQSVRQGTVSPTHFIVLRDDSNFGPDIIQRLSYKLCFLYYNWPGSIKVPACCQYAHKLAYLIGMNIQREVAEKLADKLYYL